MLKFNVTNSVCDDYLIVQDNSWAEFNVYKKDVVWLTKFVRDITWYDYDKFGYGNLFVLRWSGTDAYCENPDENKIEQDKIK